MVIELTDERLFVSVNIEEVHPFTKYTLLFIKNYVLVALHVSRKLSA